MQSSTSRLSHRAELFRSKLIEDFQLLETMTEQGRQRAPVYNSSDVLDPKVLEGILINTPEQTIKFKVYIRDEDDGVEVDRRLMRIRNQNKLPISVWAHWLVESNNFQKCLMALVIINSISIGLQGELPDAPTNVGMRVLKEVLEFIDMFTVIVFSVEIILKFIDNFKEFWKNGWNVFDLIVTIVSAVPHLIILFIGNKHSTITTVAENLSVFRILRALKMISKFGGLRIIVLTILQAFQSMVFITILLSIVAYIFAIVGVIFFESYTQSNRDDLVYRKSFSSLPNALITLFQLFTLDQWYKIYNDLTKVSNKAFTCIYILLWVWVGAFIFRNLFVGVMVNNFQSISAAVTRQQDNEDKTIEYARLKEELHNEQVKQDRKLSRRLTLQHSQRNVHFQDDEQDSNNITDDDDELILEGWDQTVRSHLLALASDPGETLWPRDTLFNYLQLLEQLQENVEEFEKLQKLAVKSILNIHNNTEEEKDE